MFNEVIYSAKSEMMGVEAWGIIINHDRKECWDRPIGILCGVHVKEGGPERKINRLEKKERKES